MLFLYLSVSIDNDNVKDVLAVTMWHCPITNDLCPRDSDSGDDIGLSSEEEAEGLSDCDYIRRKYQVRKKTKTTERSVASSGTMTSPPPSSSTRRSPRFSPPSATVTTDQPTPSTSTATTSTAVASGQHHCWGTLFPASKWSYREQWWCVGGSGSASMPFNIIPPKLGDKVCNVCQRKFHNTTALRRHQKTHTGQQRFHLSKCKLPRKLSSRISYDKHLTTCQQAKTFKCRTGKCGKTFATKAALNAHVNVHLQLVGPDQYCACGKGPFSIEKYKKESLYNV